MLDALLVERSDSANMAVWSNEDYRTGGLVDTVVGVSTNTLRTEKKSVSKAGGSHWDKQSDTHLDQ
jgi:hypothetical protein